MTALPALPASLRVPGRIEFGAGAIASIGEVAKSSGGKALLVTGGGSLRASGALDRIEASLRAAGVEFVHAAVTDEPDIAAVDAAAAAGRAAKCDVVVAVGGGSALDLGKCAAGMLWNAGSILEYLEGVGTGRTMAQPPVPLVAAPTTAGTGSEATKNAVVSGRMPDGAGFKRSFRDDRLVPAAAIIDPELMTSCPADVTAACGMDALTQLIEPLTSLNARPDVDPLCLEGIGMIARSLRTAVKHGNDLAARTDMAAAAFLSGVALSHAGLGAVHGLAGPVGGHAPIPHGMICARLLPFVTAANLTALSAGRGRTGSLDAYAKAAEALGEGITDFCSGFEFRAFGIFGFTEAMIPSVIAGATSGSMKSNPVVLTRDELTDILASAI